MKLFSNKQNSQTVRRRSNIRQPEHTQDNRDTNSFRRNKTLTGSLSSNVRSAGEKSAQLQSNRTHTHRLVNLRRRVGVVLGFVLVGAFITYLLITQFTAYLAVSLRSQPTEDVSRYQPIIQDYLGKHPIERLRFFLDQANLTNYAQAEAPEIKSISVGAGSEFATSQVKLDVRKPITSWRINKTKQYVDSSGVAFMRNYYKEPKVKVVDKSGVPARQGEAIASSRFLGFVGMLVGGIQDRDYRVKQIIIPPNTTRQIQLKIEGLPYLVKCSVDRSAGEQAEDIDRVIRYLKKKNRSPNYIDVRVEGRVFYK